MKKYTKVLCIIFCLTLIFSCGRKGGIYYPEGQKKPDFKGIFDE